SFFQSLCIISYSLFPLILSSFLNLFISTHVIRLLFCLLSIVWSSYNCILILAKFIKSNRLLISFFPICLLQLFLASFLLIK
ncbi:putative membrane protein, partial [Plasmodium gaboni]